MSLEIDVRFPSSFPYAPKECKGVAEPFLKCFTARAEKVVPEDADAGRRGMLKCLLELRAYADCMEAFEKKNPPKRLRVSTPEFHFIPLLCSLHIIVSYFLLRLLLNQVQEEYRNK